MRLDRLPPVLAREGPLGLDVWQWIALPLGMLAAVAAGALAARVVVLVARRVTVRTRNAWDDALAARARGPLTLFAAVFAAMLLARALALPGDVIDLIHRAGRAALFLAFFWALWRVVDVARHIVTTSPWAREHPGALALAPLATRVLKVIVLAVGVVALLSELGYPVASLVAGLGIGGVALALASQKTVENLFGAFSLGADQPIREGDFVKVEDFVANVEAIGLRSTRFRTLDRSVITIPNGKLAEMRLETFAPRDRIRLAFDLGLVRSTTSAQMRAVIAAVDALLRAQPKLHPDGVTVRFKQIGASSLDVEVSAWLATADWNEFTGIREELLLAILEAVERAGTALAYPTQTVQVVDARAPA